jgi:hypothetical protein
MLQWPINSTSTPQIVLDNTTLPVCVTLPKTDRDFIECQFHTQISVFSLQDFGGTEINWDATAYACMPWHELEGASNFTIQSLKPTAPAFCLLYETPKCVDRTHAMLNMPNDPPIASFGSLAGTVKGVRCHVGPGNRYIPCGEGMTVKCPDWHDEETRRKAGLQWGTGWVLV